MPTKTKKGVSNENIFTLLQNVSERLDRLDDRFVSFGHSNMREHKRFKENDEKLLAMVSNLVISVGKVEKELIFLNHHNSEHFDKDEQQDKRLTRLESHIQLPKLAF